MISKLHIWNYKSIEECELDFSKINVLIGPNGSGKTSILECFEHLKIASARIISKTITHTPPYISFKSEIGIFIPFEHFVFQREVKRNIKIKFTFTDSPLIEAELTFNRNAGTIKLVGRDVTNVDELILIPQETIFILRTDRKIERTLEGVLSKIQRIGIHNAHQIFYYTCYRSEFKENIEIIKDFYSRYGLHDIRWVPLSDNRYEIIATTEKGIDVNLADTGSGFIALFPIIVPLAFYPENSIVFIEHPEMHLHPKLQYEIANFLLDVSIKRKYQLFLETHSEHILFGLLNAIAKGVIKPSELTIYSVKKVEGISSFEKLKVYEDGSVEGGLQDFLEQDVDEFLDWLKAWE